MHGIQNLIESAAQVNLHAAITRDAASADVTYVAGAGDIDPLPASRKAIESAAERCGTLIIDLCKPGSMTTGWASLLDGLERDRGGWSAEALRRPHVFGEPPAGADPNGDVEWLAHGIMSRRDYGCAWAGRGDTGALSRTIVRDAVEFGINLLAVARHP
jgi:hypothetical protein